MNRRSLALLQLLEKLVDRPASRPATYVVCYRSQPHWVLRTTRPVQPGGFDHQPVSSGGIPSSRRCASSKRNSPRRVLTESFALHADTSDGLYGYAHGRVLNENLLMPALQASERVLPRNRDR